jgi:hypothetical protein
VARCALAVILLAVVAAAQPPGGQSQPPGRGAGAGRGVQEQAPPGFHTEVPLHPYDLILARTTREAVTLSLLPYQDMDGYVAYGPKPGDYQDRTPLRHFAKDQPAEVVLAPLQPNTRYWYQFRPDGAGSQPLGSSPEYSFHTQRPPGSVFTFTVTADSHLDERTDPALYRRTLLNALADGPDFRIDLGDTFMTEKHATREGAARQYLAQRFYFGLLGHSAPLFLVLGNHDGEGSRQADGTADSLAVWANTTRKRYFPNPIPDGFYSGNVTPDRFAGPLEDYYAWEWGDALLVMLDRCGSR